MYILSSIQQTSCSPNNEILQRKRKVVPLQIQKHKAEVKSTEQIHIFLSMFATNYDIAARHVR